MPETDAEIIMSCFFSLQSFFSSEKKKEKKERIRCAYSTEVPLVHRLEENTK